MATANRARSTWADVEAAKAVVAGCTLVTGTTTFRSTPVTGGRRRLTDAVEHRLIHEGCHLPTDALHAVSWTACGQSPRWRRHVRGGGWLNRRRELVRRRDGHNGGESFR
jgi:hypothetical protein